MKTICVKLHDFRGLLSVIGMVIGNVSIYLGKWAERWTRLDKKEIIFMIGSLLVISHNYFRKKKFGHILEGCMSLS
jgi:hypothetical protein